MHVEHTHFICRNCMALLCDLKEGHSTPVLCIKCGGCSWIFVPSIPVLDKLPTESIKAVLDYVELVVQLHKRGFYNERKLSR